MDRMFEGGGTECLAGSRVEPHIIDTTSHVWRAVGRGKEMKGRYVGLVVSMGR
ncbi:hypothetical protein BVRB_5g116800 [Beta vulgaris subsp. vulgaris]|nr:hypothetical protein BVRB_5g116800 [Beta vulgaris subsp. vulgaris]